MAVERTMVIFRKWKDTGTIIALFPELPSDYHGFYCDSYEHVGQHGGADYYGVMRATQPVKLNEANALAAELRRRGYRLLIRKRAAYRSHELRRNAAAALLIGVD